MAAVFSQTSPLMMTLEGRNAPSAAGLVAPVRLKIVQNEQEAPNCRFWVGLSQAGTVHPKALLTRLTSIYELLLRAATLGLSESGPMMLTESTETTPRYIYLTPPPPTAHEGLWGQRPVWLHDVASVLAGWRPRAWGLYLAPQLVDGQQSLQLTGELVYEVLASHREIWCAQASACPDPPGSPDSPIYLLLGDHGLDDLLNALLALKSPLGELGIALEVFH